MGGTNLPEQLCPKQMNCEGDETKDGEREDDQPVPGLYNKMIGHFCLTCGGYFALLGVGGAEAFSHDFLT